MEKAKALQDDEYDLGTYSRKVSTLSADAQEWFDRALLWTYGFNHEAAIRCYQVVIELDPTCAMAHWGVAHCNGINYNIQRLNKQPGRYPSNADACIHASLAGSLTEYASLAERRLIEAVQVRCVDPIPSTCEEKQKVNSAYANAMKKISEEYPDDPDVSALYAESLMNIYPWALWVNGKVRAADEYFEGTARILEVLRSGLAKNPNHPGLLHMYLHAMEMGPTPEDCLPEADRLSDLTPDAGHLLHMPSHIYVLIGDYAKAAATNTKAIAANAKFIARSQGAHHFYLLYCCHDCHMLVYAAMLGGNRQKATVAAEITRTWIARDEVQDMMRNGMADCLETFAALHMHVKVRFGLWQEILDEPLLADEEMHCVSLTIFRYARCLAYAALRQVENATAELELLKEAHANIAPTRIFFNNACHVVLAVALAMAEGEVAYRRGDFQVAFEHLRRAVELDDGLLYEEPWGWMQPARHALGALLMEQGHMEEAVDVYREDLKPGHHPRNIWSLHGLVECLEKSPSLAAEGELDEVQGELEEARKFADVKIKASCLCRLSAC